MENNRRINLYHFNWRDVIYVIVLVVSVSLAFGKNNAAVKYNKEQIIEIKESFKDLQFKQAKLYSNQNEILVELGKIVERLKTIDEKLNKLDK